MKTTYAEQVASNIIEARAALVHARREQDREQLAQYIERSEQTLADRADRIIALNAQGWETWHAVRAQA